MEGKWSMFWSRPRLWRTLRLSGRLLTLGASTAKPIVRRLTASAALVLVSRVGGSARRRDGGTDSLASRSSMRYSMDWGPLPVCACRLFATLSRQIFPTWLVVPGGRQAFANSASQTRKVLAVIV